MTPFYLCGYNGWFVGGLRNGSNAGPVERLDYALAGGRTLTPRILQLTTFVAGAWLVSAVNNAAVSSVETVLPLRCKRISPILFGMPCYLPALTMRYFLITPGWTPLMLFHLLSQNGLRGALCRTYPSNYLLPTDLPSPLPAIKRRTMPSSLYCGQFVFVSSLGNGSMAWWAGRTNAAHCALLRAVRAADINSGRCAYGARVPASVIAFSSTLAAVEHYLLPAGSFACRGWDALVLLCGSSTGLPSPLLIICAELHVRYCVWCGSVAAHCGGIPLGRGGLGCWTGSCYLGSACLLGCGFYRTPHVFRCSGWTFLLCLGGADISFYSSASSYVCRAVVANRFTCAVETLRVRFVLHQHLGSVAFAASDFYDILLLLHSFYLFLTMVLFYLRHGVRCYTLLLPVLFRTCLAFITIPTAITVCFIANIPTRRSVYTPVLAVCRWNGGEFYILALGCFRA